MKIFLILFTIAHVLQTSDALGTLSVKDLDNKEGYPDSKYVRNLYQWEVGDSVNLNGDPKYPTEWATTREICAISCRDKYPNGNHIYMKDVNGDSTFTQCSCTSNPVAEGVSMSNDIIDHHLFKTYRICNACTGNTFSGCSTKKSGLIENSKLKIQIILFAVEAVEMIIRIDKMFLNC